MDKPEKPEDSDHEITGVKEVGEIYYEKTPEEKARAKIWVEEALTLLRKKPASRSKPVDNKSMEPKPYERE